jgi:DNA-binding transcriptional LysR family regulator
MGMDLDLRKLRYFAAVAEQGHFGRAASQLYIAQPVLSRQVRALEAELGFPLFVRTTRSVQLTPAGKQLYDDAAGVLAAAAAATRRAREVASGLERLVIGFGPALRISGALRAYAQAHPDVEVELVQLDWDEQAGALREGRVDVAYIPRPSDGRGLRIIAVGSERKVACLPANHALAARRRLTLADLVNENILNLKERHTRTAEEKFELIAAGQAIALLPLYVARYYSRPDVVHRTIVDAEPQQLCLGVAEDRKQRHVLDFLDIAEQVLAERQ